VTSAVGILIVDDVCDVVVLTLADGSPRYKTEYGHNKGNQTVSVPFVVPGEQLPLHPQVEARQRVDNC
jgi:hypothetical protein